MLVFFFWAWWSNISFFTLFHNPAQFPHNRRFLLHNLPPKTRTIFLFFPAPCKKACMRPLHLYLNYVGFWSLQDMHLKVVYILAHWFLNCFTGVCSIILTKMRARKKYRWSVNTCTSYLETERVGREKSQFLWNWC